MELKIDNIDVKEIVQQALANSLIQKLDRILPKVVEDIINGKPQYGKEDIVTASLRSAVTLEIERGIAEFLIDRAESIRRLVRGALEQKINPQFVSECVTGELERMKITVHPFKRPVTKAMVPSLDEEES